MHGNWTKVANIGGINRVVDNWGINRVADDRWINAVIPKVLVVFGERCKKMPWAAKMQPCELA